MKSPFLREAIFFKHAPHAAGSPALEVSGLCVSYAGRPALEEVSFSLRRGERVAVVGPNGAGKTTLFHAVSGLRQPGRGEIRIYGQDPQKHICIAYMVQRSAVDWSFPVTVGDVVMMGRAGAIGLFRHAGAEDRALVRQCLQQVGLLEMAERQIGELSGGQQQRMFIARALAQEAELMLMDEPFTGLDMTSQSGIVRLLEDLSARNVTVMVATHDLNLAAEHFDRVMLLNRRLVALGEPGGVFTPERIFDAFGGQSRPIRTAAGLWVVNDTCCEGGAHDRPGD